MRGFVVGVALALSSAACSSNSDFRSGSVEFDAWSGELPIAAPWLRSRLPHTVLTYQRIPHPLGSTAIPKGNVFDAALGNDANVLDLRQHARAEVFAVFVPLSR